ncbi:unnamed protein product, partial [marine sediment metagenome]
NGVRVKKIHPLIKIGMCIWCMFIVGVVIEQRWMKKAQLTVCDELCMRGRQELNDLAALGFSFDDVVMQLSHQRAQRVEDKKQNVKKSWIMRKYVSHNVQQKIDSLEKTITLYKKQIAGYARDIRDYRALGLKFHDDTVKFSYESMMQLKLDLVELQVQYDVMKASRIGSYMFAHKLFTFLEDIEQSIDQYKNALHDFKQRGISKDTQHVLFARNQLLQRFKMRDQLEELLD